MVLNKQTEHVLTIVMDAIVTVVYRYNRLQLLANQGMRSMHLQLLRKTV